ncbi:hypothetical protein [Terrabacter sp. Ter38]|uniref:hypothetical protein n=1 Tax=Terrabacter sp. Ter38 TaxID=2926030 RepID=UPI0021192EDB|nr:hypothetical protein [Terrabacter sp. Ter38]
MVEEPSFIEALAGRLGGREAAEAMCGAFAEVVLGEVARGGRVAVAGFGVFDAGTPKATKNGIVRLRFRPGIRFRTMVDETPAQGTATEAAHPVRPQRGSPGRAPANRRPPAPGAVRSKPGKVLAFRHYEAPPGVSLSAILPAGSPRCGIYVLHFDDGYRYVGQARDVLTRFASHRRHWVGRVAGLDFAPAAPSELDDLERRTIQRLERDGVGPYNSALVGLPMGESTLDVVVDRVEQERWLDGAIDGEYDLRDRVAAAVAHPRAGGKFEALRARADYPELRLALLVYLLSVVPWPHETERRFWSITSMPSTNQSRTQRRLSTISVNNVETLVVAEALGPDGWVMNGFVNVSPGKLMRHPQDGGPLKQGHYRTVGDVDSIYFVGAAGLIDLLQRPDVVEPARRLTLGLMRKGRGMMAKYHDDNLANDLFALLAELDPD